MHQRLVLPLRSVVAAVVGISRATGPSLPCLGSLLLDRARRAMTASSSSLVQEPTTSSAL